MDRDVVEQARAGDRDAFELLAYSVSDSLYAIAYRILRDPAPAQDALQAALVTVWRKLPQLRDVDRFEPWARRVLVRECYREARRTRSLRHGSEPRGDDAASWGDPAIGLERRDLLERAFRTIPLDQRAVFVLHHYVGLPLVEIADALDIPAGTARSRLHYATRALRSALVTADSPRAKESPA